MLFTAVQLCIHGRQLFPLVLELTMHALVLLSHARYVLQVEDVLGMYFNSLYSGV